MSGAAEVITGDPWFDADSLLEQRGSRVWREEFDGLKPIRPIAYKKPAKTEEPRPPKRGRLARLD